MKKSPVKGSNGVSIITLLFIFRSYYYVLLYYPFFKVFTNFPLKVVDKFWLHKFHVSFSRVGSKPLSISNPDLQKSKCQKVILHAFFIYFLWLQILVVVSQNFCQDSCHDFFNCGSRMYIVGGGKRQKKPEYIIISHVSPFYSFCQIGVYPPLRTRDLCVVISCIINLYCVILVRGGGVIEKFPFMFEKPYLMNSVKGLWSITIVENFKNLSNKVNFIR